MKFTDLQKILEDRLGVIRLADIARELEVTPQVVSNWKSRNQVPYKNVKKLRERIQVSKRNINLTETENIKSNDDMIYNDNDINFLEIGKKLYKVFLSGYIFIAGSTLMFFLFSLIHLKFIATPVYYSFAKVLPFAESKQGSKMSNLASQFGFDLSANSPQGTLSSALMIPEIIKSRRLASELLNYKFDTKKFGKDFTLASILSEKVVEIDTISQKKKYKLISKAKKLIGVSQKKGSPLLHINAKTFEPKFARDLVNSTLDRCAIIINNYQFSELEEKKSYINNRLADVEKDLIQKEEILKTFREKNRTILSSPSLMLEQGRLLRDVEVQNELYIRLKAEFELVQIEEVGSRSSMQILDSPEIPIKKISPKPKEFIILLTLIGFSLGYGLVFSRQWLLENKISSFLSNDYTN